MAETMPMFTDFVFPRSFPDQLRQAPPYSIRRRINLFRDFAYTNGSPLWYVFVRRPECCRLVDMWLTAGSRGSFFFSTCFVRFESFTWSFDGPRVSAMHGLPTVEGRVEHLGPTVEYLEACSSPESARLRLIFPSTTNCCCEFCVPPSARKMVAP